MAFKPSYNIMDRDTHNALVNAFKTGGIAYTDDDGTVHKISDDYVNASGGGSDLPEVTSSDEGKVLAVNASGEWAAEQKIFNLIYDEDENAFNLTPEQSFELFKTGVRIVWYDAYIDTEDTTTVNAMRNEYITLNYDNGVYKMSTGVNEIVADTFTSPFYID